MSTGTAPSLQVKLNGYFEPGFSSDEKVVVDVTGGVPTPGMILPAHIPDTPMFDGRELQARETDGSVAAECEFFAKHGFLLLQHESRVENWDSGVFGPTDALDIGPRDVPTYAGENEIESRYLPEVDELIRTRLLPGQSVEIQQPNMLLRRGKNTPNPFFGQVVHNDYGVSATDYEDNAAAFSGDEGAQGWRARYDGGDVDGFMVINFWRTVHMSQPLRHLPLAVLDAASLEIDDVISTGLRGFSPTGRVTNQLSLRYNPAQRWYFYPDMTTSEVLVLKLFECHKTDQARIARNSYHSAFEDPTTPTGAEERQSCEHRVNVFLLNS